jgi:urea transport system permease protein
VKILVLLLATLAAALAGPAPAQERDLEALIAELPEGGFDERAETIRRIAETGDPRAERVLQLLGDGDLEVMKDTGEVVRLESRGRDDFAFRLFTGEELGEVGRRDTSAIRVNNNLRREIQAALGILRLTSEDRSVRARAAEAMLDAADPDQIPTIERALEREEGPAIASTLRLARAAAVLEDADAGTEAKVAAVETLAEEGGVSQIGRIRTAAASGEPEVAEAAEAAIAGVERMQAVWGAAQNVWFGLSLGSVLMLAAIGLAITFGVMGVINMAHGELVMLGAYTTFAVQETIRLHAPELFGASLAIALPLAFLVSGAVGVAIERGVVRFLYGRPLETLLATWGVSLILQQAVRTIFGPNNREVGNPDWMSGAFELGQLTITYNRLWIIVFALVVFALLIAVLRFTPLGLQMRAVTQNRSMASVMGVRTGWVDAMTFGLGAGVAGIAGVALSQIGNVSPNLGQSYIVDSFMVVVFGGVGNLWGALAGAFSLGIANKFLEPYAGAVLAKVLVLVAIILFIQKRPRGLFALRGRAVEG